MLELCFNRRWDDDKPMGFTGLQHKANGMIKNTPIYSSRPGAVFIMIWVNYYFFLSCWLLILLEGEQSIAVV